MTPRSLVENFRRFGGIRCNHPLSRRVAYSSETLVKIYRSTRRHFPEDSNFHTHRRGNLKSHQSSDTTLTQICTNCSFFSPSKQVYFNGTISFLHEPFQRCLKNAEILLKIFLVRNAYRWIVRIPTTTRFYV
jgi:hypothetical protein